MRWILKAIAARWPAVALSATAVRWMFLYALGHPVAALAALSAVLVDANFVGVAGAVVVGVAVEYLLAGSFEPLNVWMFTIWFWRTWPIRWAEVAGKTGSVQAVTGGENQQKAASRPVLDAPAIWPDSISRSGCSFRCGPPPGRTFAQLVEVADQIAASDARIVSVEIGYQTSSSSSGTLFAGTVDPLVDVGRPSW